MTRGSTRDADHRSGLPDVGNISIGAHEIGRLTSGQAAMLKTQTMRHGNVANRGPVAIYPLSGLA